MQLSQNIGLSILIVQSIFTSRVKFTDPKGEEIDMKEEIEITFFLGCNKERSNGCFSNQIIVCLHVPLLNKGK